jgi:hypothetical protein
MSADVLERLQEQLRELPPDKLAVVAEFVAFLKQRAELRDANEAMLLSQDVLAECWLSPEDEAAWADL